MRVSLSLLRALEESTGKGWFRYSELKEALGEEAFNTLLEGYALGLYRIRGEEEFEIRLEGLRLLDIWRASGRPRVDPWVDSRILTMLESAAATGRIPGEWAELLGERGLATGDRLEPHAEELLDLAGRLERGLVVTKAMARELAKAPEGPAEKGSYGRFLGLFEAMGLLVGTVHLNQYYSLTSAGRLLRAALRRANLDAPWPSLVNPRIIQILEKAERGEELEPGEKTYAGTIGFLKPTGELDYPGRLVLEAYRSLGAGRHIPPMALTSHEERLLKAIADLWREKEEAKPNILVDKERIAEKYREEWSEDPGQELGLDLMHLESLGLIEEATEDHKTVYRLTARGRELAGLPGIGQGSPVEAVKSITEPLSNRSPSMEWISKGLEHGVIATGGPTRRGRLLARASGAGRRLLVTRPEAIALQSIPEERSIQRRVLEERIREAGGDPGKALDRLETRGLLRTLVDGSIVLTRAGRIVKTVLIAVPSGIAVPINPVLVRVLQALAEMGREDLAEIVNRTGLTLETVREAIILARAAKLLGRGGGLTMPGRALLEAHKILSGDQETGE
ncbi:MAG: DUF505 domain-containing protein [Desulfurococcales archaeon]|nr:DUF505 domain-containing protein [Desulfurococcales archaeon]